MGSYGRIVQINIIEGTGVLGEGVKESFGSRRGKRTY